MRFGWYYEDGGNRCAEDDDLWLLVEQAVREAAHDPLPGQLDRVRVGHIDDVAADSLLDEEDIVSMRDEGRLSAENILELLDERCADCFVDGGASFRCSKREADESLAAVLAHYHDRDVARAVFSWASAYIELDPSSVCYGSYPLPIEYREGEWTFGGDHNPEPDEDDEPAAVITYATEPSPETGHIGWCWWALGNMGDAPSLRDAMAAAEEAIGRRRRVS